MLLVLIIFSIGVIGGMACYFPLLWIVAMCHIYVLCRVVVGRLCCFDDVSYMSGLLLVFMLDVCCVCWGVLVCMQSVCCVVIVCVVLVKQKSYILFVWGVVGIVFNKRFDFGVLWVYIKAFMCCRWICILRLVRV